MKNWKPLVILVSFVPSLGIVIARMLSNTFLTGGWRTWVAAVILIAVWGIVLGVSLWRERSVKTTVVTVLAVTVMGMLLVFPYNMSMKETFITITATGEKNEESNSTEVWLTEFAPDGKPYDLTQYVPNDDWQIRENVLLTWNGTITFKLPWYDKLNIKFNAHPWSGIIEITTPAGTERYDLYRSPNEDFGFKLDLPFTPQVEYPLALDLLFILAALCALAMVWRIKFIRGTKEPEPHERTIKQGIRYLAIPVITPLLFMFYLYNQNQTYLDYFQVLLAVLLLAVISGLVYLLLFKYICNCRSAALIIMVWWIYFFTFNTLFNFVWRTGNIYIFFTVTIFILFILFFGIHMLTARLKRQEIYIGVSVMLSVLFLFNFVPSTYMHIRYGNVTTNEYKTQFEIDTALPKPNIYWIHMDGMMSFASIERTFGDAQEDFRRELQERGFLINEDAWFEAGHSTAYSLPMMLSPQYYDRVGEEIFTTEGLDSAVDSKSFWNNMKILDSKANEFLQVRLNHEIFKALQDSGYYTNLIFGNPGFYFGHMASRIYDIFDKKTGKNVLLPISGKNPYQASKIIERLFNLNDLLGRTTLTTFVEEYIHELITNEQRSFWQLNALEIGNSAWELVGVHADLEYVNMVAALQDSLNTFSPRFTFVFNEITHRPFYHNENGDRVNTAKTGDDVTNYMPNHKYAVKVLLGMIDMILEKDPDAVIIIEGDHGIHHNGGANQMLEWGLTLQQVRDVWNGVMSAVRIPEKYGGLDEPLHPLNITRELVNRFVGNNYELLPPDQPNQRKPELTEADWAKWNYQDILNNNK